MAARSDGIDSLIESLPERFSPGVSEPVTARFRLRAGSVVRDVVLSEGHCVVEDPGGRSADVEIDSDPGTWKEIFEGRLSGLEAFVEKRLSMRGSIERSLHFEPSFRRPEGPGLRYRLRRVEVGGVGLSVLEAGHAVAPPLVLLHGLGATRASWLTVIPQLARAHRVLALDLPGFGSSSKPIGRYDAAWFADHVFGLMDALEVDHGFVAGNSMGGRIAMEMAMRNPERVDAISCLCPAAAFTDRPGLSLVRMLRPELGLLAVRLPRSRVRAALKGMFADPSCLDDTWYEAAIDDFLEYWRSPRSRLAFFAAARRIFLDEPEGERGFWMRLAAMSVPALYIYGEHDGLITSRFARRIRSTLPHAEVRVWSDCGHVPQVELPDRTADALTSFFSTVERGRGPRSVEGRSAV